MIPKNYQTKGFYLTSCVIMMSKPCWVPKNKVQHAALDFSLLKLGGSQVTSPARLQYTMDSDDDLAMSWSIVTDRAPEIILGLSWIVHVPPWYLYIHEYVYNYTWICICIICTRVDTTYYGTIPNGNFTTTSSNENLVMDEDLVEDHPGFASRSGARGARPCN